MDINIRYPDAVLRNEKARGGSEHERLYPRRERSQRVSYPALRHIGGRFSGRLCPPGGPEEEKEPPGREGGGPGAGLPDRGRRRRRGGRRPVRSSVRRHRRHHHLRGPDPPVGGERVQRAQRLPHERRRDLRRQRGRHRGHHGGRGDHQLVGHDHLRGGGGLRLRHHPGRLYRHQLPRHQRPGGPDHHGGHVRRHHLSRRGGGLR